MPRRTPRNVALSIWFSTCEHARLQAMAAERAKLAGLMEPVSIGSVVRSLLAREIAPDVADTTPPPRAA